MVSWQSDERVDAPTPRAEEVGATKCISPLKGRRFIIRHRSRPGLTSTSQWQVSNSIIIWQSRANPSHQADRPSQQHHKPRPPRENQHDHLHSRTNCEETHGHLLQCLQIYKHKVHPRSLIHVLHTVRLADRQTLWLTDKQTATTGCFGVIVLRVQ